MQLSGITQIVVLATLVCLCHISADMFADIQQQIDSITARTCSKGAQGSLFLPADAVSDYPVASTISRNFVFANRTNLHFLHNLVLSRSFFNSFILQNRYRYSTRDGHGNNPTARELDPGMLYYFLAVAADVASTAYINASAIYFSPNSSYSPSFRSNYNLTFPYFAPRAVRVDDYNMQFLFERVSTLNTIRVEDLGVFDLKTRPHLDYTSAHYGINQWYTDWLPDYSRRHGTKHVYTISMKHADGSTETFDLHGPPAPHDTNNPQVKWFAPYFDCERTNTWLAGATSPIVDKVRRHTGFPKFEYPRYTAVSAIELNFDTIDIDQCDPSVGWQAGSHQAGSARGRRHHNLYASTHRCHVTTQCEPIDGYGFRRGGYECRCRSNYRLPITVGRPYLGEALEHASIEGQLNRDAFSCRPIVSFWQQQQFSDLGEPKNRFEREILLSRLRYRPADSANDGRRGDHKGLQPPASRVADLRRFIDSVTAGNCHTYSKSDLVLPSDTIHGADKQFRAHSQMALRLANFLSAFLQITDGSVSNGNRLPDTPLSADQLIAEVVAVLAADYHVRAAGVYWDVDKFVAPTTRDGVRRPLFAPFAYKVGDSDLLNYVDLAAHEFSGNNSYLNNPLFKRIKTRWSTNFDDLESIRVFMRFRTDARYNVHLEKFSSYPYIYRAANLSMGQWSAPYFDCGGFDPEWRIDYAAPFFGFDQLKESLELKGMVKISARYTRLNINQCDQSNSWTPNAFRGTHRCDRETTYCVPIEGRQLQSGSYRCECLQGLEYPFLDDRFNYYLGDDIENEFDRLLNNRPNIIEHKVCTVAASSNQLSCSVWLFLLSFVSCIPLTKHLLFT